MKKLSYEDLPNLSIDQELLYELKSPQGRIRAVVKIDASLINYTIPIKFVDVLEKTGIYANVQFEFKHVDVRDLHIFTQEDLNKIKKEVSSTNG